MRATGSLASLAYGKARGAAIRRDLIDLVAGTARHERGRITLHLAEDWQREQERMTLFTAACARQPQRPDPPGPGHRASRSPAPPNPDP